MIRKLPNINNYRLTINILLFYLLEILIKSNEKSEISIKVNEIGNQQILSDSYIGEPSDYIIYNGTIINYTNNIISVNNPENEIKIVWNHVITNCNSMFYPLKNIIKVDLSKFDSSKVTDMGKMFSDCYNLISINLNNLNTSSVTNMERMFRCCHAIKILNLNSSNISLVTNFNEMFDHCNELISINLNNFNTSNVLYYSNMFSRITITNIKYCINETKASNIITLFSSFIYNCTDICNNNGDFIFEYNGICYEKCPNNTKMIYDNHSYLCEDIIYENIETSIIYNEDNENIICKNNYKFYKYNNSYFCTKECPKEMQYEIIDTKECIKECKVSGLFENKCIINHESNIEEKDDIIKKIKNGITNGEMNELITKIIEDKEDFYINITNVIYQISSTENQNNNKYINISTIKLEDCEKELRKHYKINDSIPLLIFKIDIYEEGFSIPTVQYEVYNSKTKEQLNLTFCDNTKIKIFYPASINGDIKKYNLSDDFYNNICSIYTTENGTDITLSDRQKEFNKNNMSLCETNCEYNGYDNDTKSAECNCEIKIKLPLISEIVINKDKILNSFTNIRNSTNFKVVKCYKLLFSIDGIKKNICFYILLSIIMIIIICFILFLIKGYRIILKIINKIVSFNLNNSKNIKKKKGNIIKKEIKKNIKINKKEKNKKIEIKGNIVNIINFNKNNNEIKTKNIQKEKKNIRKNINKKYQNNKDKKSKKGPFSKEISKNPPKKNKHKKKLNINNIKTSGDRTSFSQFISKNAGLLNKKEEKNNNNNKSINNNIDINSKIMKFNDYEYNTLNYKEALILDKRTYFNYIKIINIIF